MPSPTSHARRTILTAGAVLVAVSSAGCLFSRGVRKGATDVVIHNEAKKERSVTLTITDGESDRPRLEQTVSLESTAQSTPTQTDKLPVGADYTIDVDVDGGPSETYEWNDVRLERAPLHVIVDESSNVLFALQVG